MSNWFRLWLENADAFFYWLDSVRKRSQEFKAKISHAERRK